MFNRVAILRVLCVVALAASAASFADQSLVEGTFCSFESGCESVASSAYGRPLGIPLPVAGIVGFAAILGLSLIAKPWAASLTRWLSLLAGLAGLALILVQVAVLHRICPLCLVTDGCAVGIGCLAVRSFPSSSPSSTVRAVWLVLGVLAILAPLVVAYADVQADPPDWVQAHWVDGKITIVEVTDFECEHCRRADEHIRAALKDRTDVNLVRIPVEMPKHPNARTAAIAFRAAKAQGRGNEMAEALFAAKGLSAYECREIAARLGLNLPEYDRALSDPATDRDVSSANAAAKAAGPGVPLIWIQSRMIFGSVTTESFDGPLSRSRPHRAK